MADNELLKALLSVGGNVKPSLYNIDVNNPIVLDKPVNANLAGSIINVIPNNAGKYAALHLVGQGITLINGTIIGDKDHHQGTDGQWGFGVYIDGASQVVIQGMTIKQCWGDGIYIGGNAKNVMIDSVTCDDNRRQGMSIVSGQQIMVRNSTFSNTQGTRPQDGIDIEPDKGDVITDLSIVGCRFNHNAGAQIEIAGKRGTVKRVLVKGNTFVGNTKPLKVAGVPGAAQPSLIAKVFAFFGNYDKWPQEITIA